MQPMCKQSVWEMLKTNHTSLGRFCGCGCVTCRDVTCGVDGWCNGPGAHNKLLMAQHKQHSTFFLDCVTVVSRCLWIIMIFACGCAHCICVSVSCFSPFELSDQPQELGFTKPCSTMGRRWRTKDSGLHHEHLHTAARFGYVPIAVDKFFPCVRAAVVVFTDGSEAAPKSQLSHL